MEQSKEYYAFISYKREDEKWAKWLQDKLEHYRFPTNLNGRTDLPKNIRPTFRDVTDLNPGLLAEEINNALHNSEWLIVVCSPRAAKSRWVCKEAQTFIDMGRADHIIPFVIEGIPFSNDTATECYPEALLNLTGSQELLATNINEMGRDAAAIKVVARMFNLRFDTLWQRFEREKKKKRWFFIVSVIILALLSIGIAVWMSWMNNRLETQNKQLTIENIKVESREILSHLEKGEFVQALSQTESLSTLWQDDYRMEAPVFEQALRAMYRYMNPDGIMKLYSLPFMGMQQIMDADNDYIFLRDHSTKHHQVIRYYTHKGELVDTLFPACSWQKKNGYREEVEDVQGGLVLYLQMKDDASKQMGTLRLYDSHTHIDYAFKGNYFGGEFLSNKYIIAYPRLGEDNARLFSIERKAIKHIDDLNLPNLGNRHMYLLGDTLIITNGEQVHAWSITHRDWIYEIDYTQKYEENYICDNNLSPTISKNNKMLALSHEKEGLMIISTEQDSIIKLDCQKTHSSVAVNENGDLIAVKKNDSDSLIVYYNNKPLFSTTIRHAYELRFAGNNILLVESGNGISSYLIYASYELRGLYAPDGYTYLNYQNHNIEEQYYQVYNDTLEQPVLSIKFNPSNNIKFVGFSPQSDYVYLSTDSTDFIVIDYQKQKTVFGIKTSEIPWDDKYSFYLKRSYQICDNENVIMLYLDKGNPYLDKNDEIYLYGISSGKRRVYPISPQTFSCAIGPDGRIIATSMHRETIIRDTAQWNQPLAIIPAIPQCSINNTTFTPDGKQLVICYSDGSLRVWNITDGTLAAPVAKFFDDEETWDINVSPDGQYGICTCRKDYGKWDFYVWHIPTGQLVDHINTDWIWPITTPYQRSVMSFSAMFARSSPTAIIVNEQSFLGLSRVYEFIPFEDLLDFFRNL